MKKLDITVVVGIGVWQWYNGDYPFMSPVNAFDGAGQPIVQMFTADKCGKARLMTRNKLKRRQVSYKETRIDPDIVTSYFPKAALTRIII